MDVENSLNGVVDISSALVGLGSQSPNVDLIGLHSSSWNTDGEGQPSLIKNLNGTVSALSLTTYSPKIIVDIEGLVIPSPLTATASQLWVHRTLNGLCVPVAYCSYKRIHKLSSELNELDRLDYAEKRDVLKKDVINDLTKIKKKINFINDILKDTKDGAYAIDNTFGYGDMTEISNEYSIYLQADPIVDLNGVVCPSVEGLGNPTFPVYTLNGVVVAITETTISEVYDLFGVVVPVYSNLYVPRERWLKNLDGAVSYSTSLSFHSFKNVNKDLDGLITSSTRPVGIYSVDTVVDLSGIVDSATELGLFSHQNNYTRNAIGTVDTVSDVTGYGEINVFISLSGVTNIISNLSDPLFQNNYSKDLNGLIESEMYSVGIGYADFEVDLSGLISPVINVSEPDYEVDFEVDLSGLISYSKSITFDYSFDPDETDPVITLLGSTNIYLDLGDSYSEPGYTASDDRDGDITEDVIVTGAINTNVVGSYTKYYNVTDDAGNSAATKTRTIHVEDNESPTITLIGSSVVTINQGDSYLDPGATASDNYDGNITDDIIAISDVNTGVAGTYHVYYNVTDSSGNEAVPVSRTINVVYVDNVKPVILLSGFINVYLALGGTYSEPGYSATDNVDGNITSGVVVSGTIDNSVIGTYQLTYSVSDDAGNSAIPKTRNVIIVDDLEPGITLIGASTIYVEQHSSFSDPGATAYDNYDGDISGDIVVSGDTVRTHIPGTYNIYYNVTDSSGNEATTKTRQVIVFDPGLA